MSESIDFAVDSPEDKKQPDDLASVMIDFFTSLNIKLILFIVILFLFVSSDIFVDKVLDRFSGATSNKRPTTKGIFLQAGFLALFYITVDLLIQLGAI